MEFADLPEHEEALLVFGNETLLLTALKNIVVNACKYSANHLAKVRLATSDRQLLITVEDNGIGISKENLATIFQPFYRLDENSNAEGFGLGLSLADRIIKLHKGVISVQSQKGVGTVFTIQLPAASTLTGL
jgi:signal transduction histidine kinase